MVPPRGVTPGDSLVVVRKSPVAFLSIYDPDIIFSLWTLDSLVLR